MSLTVELIAPGFCAQVDDSTCELPPVRTQIVVLDFEFSNRILRRNHNRQVDVADIQGLAVQILSALIRERPADLIVAPTERVLAHRRAARAALCNRGG